MTKTIIDYARAGTGPISLIADEQLLSYAAIRARRLAHTLRQIQRHTTDRRWTKAVATAKRQARVLEAMAGATPSPYPDPEDRWVELIPLLQDAYSTTGEMHVLPNLMGSYRATFQDRISRVQSCIASIRIDLGDWLRDLGAHPTKEASDPE